jgi:hypothetical protein
MGSMRVKGRRWENFMDAKYNWIIDSFAIRTAVNIFAFAAWLAVAVALLSMA